MTSDLVTLRARLATIEAKLDDVSKPDSLAQHFPLGRVGFRSQTARQRRRQDAATDRSVDEAVVRVELMKERDALRRRIADIESGGPGRRAKAVADRLAWLQSARVGAVVMDSAYGLVRVVRRNKNGLTIETPSGYREARSWSLLLGAGAAR